MAGKIVHAVTECVWVNQDNLDWYCFIAEILDYFINRTDSQRKDEEIMSQYVKYGNPLKMYGWMI